MVTHRSLSIDHARDGPTTKIIRVGERVYERLNELRLTKYGSKKSFTLVIADLLEKSELREKQE